MKSISYMRDAREPWLWAFDLSGVRVLLVLALIGVILFAGILR
jgi:hypothetical protein